MKTRTLSFRARFQNTDTKNERSSRLEYPLTRAPSTASESINKIRSAPCKRSSKVARATMGASISIGTIWVVLSIHLAFTAWGTNDVNCRGLRNLRSNKTPPIRSGNFSEDLGSGVKPSVKITTSAGLLWATSIGRGGPEWTRCFHCLRASSRAVPRTKVLALWDRPEERSPNFTPQLWSTEHQFPFELPSRTWI